MWVAIVALRALAVLGPYLLSLLFFLYRVPSAPRAVVAAPAAPPGKGSRVPLIATFFAFGLMCAFLGGPFTVPGLDDTGFLLCGLAGVALMVVGTLIAYRARAALGASWSLAPRASHATGLVTSGPYARIRHPVYLGLALGVLAIAVAFANWAAVLAFLLLILPCLLWRAREEERVLTAVFGDEYRLYRQRTRMLIPYLL
jgi:protein-S-isoprenylcysteine O-methyltransferase Ste14